MRIVPSMERQHVMPTVALKATCLSKKGPLTKFELAMMNAFLSSLGDAVSNIISILSRYTVFKLCSSNGSMVFKNYFSKLAEVPYLSWVLWEHALTAHSVSRNNEVTPKKNTQSFIGFPLELKSTNQDAFGEFLFTLTVQLPCVICCCA